METLTRQEALDILGIPTLYAIVNSKKPELTSEQRRAAARENLRIRDEQRAKDLGLIKKPIFKNGIICKGERVAPNKTVKTTNVLFEARQKTR